MPLTMGLQNCSAWLLSVLNRTKELAADILIFRNFFHFALENAKEKLHKTPFYFPSFVDIIIVYSHSSPGYNITLNHPLLIHPLSVTSGRLKSSLHTAILRVCACSRY